MVSNMLKRRSFLAMLGLAPVAPALAKLPAKPLAAPIVKTAAPTAIEGVVMANVRMPIKIGLTQEQVDFCEIAGLDINEYAKNLLELKKHGRIEGSVGVDEKLLEGITNKPEFAKPKTIKDLKREEELKKPWVLSRFVKSAPEPEKRLEPVITYEMDNQYKGMTEIQPGVWVGS